MNRFPRIWRAASRGIYASSRVTRDCLFENSGSNLPGVTVTCRINQRVKPSTWVTSRFSTAALPFPDNVRQFRLAQTGEGIKECELIQWFVQEGDKVEEFQRICEVQSDKATLEITSPFAGKIKRLHYTAGDTVEVGQVLADIAVKGGDELSSLEEAPKGDMPCTPGPGAEAQNAQISTSPAVRRIARELGIDLAHVKGTGPGQRITKADLVSFHDNNRGLAITPGSIASTTKAAEVSPASAVPTEAKFVPATVATDSSQVDTTVPLRGFRKAMVRSMTLAGEIPHFYFCEQVHMDALMEVRARVRDAAELGGAKLTYLPFLMKSAAMALMEYPALRSSLKPEGDALLQHEIINIGVAVATHHGLVVPNVKDVGGRSIASLAKELARLQGAAMANQLRPEDLSGAVFTLSNIGSVGGMYAMPLINPPEVAIMAVGRIERLPRFLPNSSTVVPTHLMSITLGADHRVVDGATLAGFAMSWKALVEDPARMLLALK